MAQPAGSAADSIRSLKDDDAVFRAFDSYPWVKDKSFMVCYTLYPALSSSVLGYI